MQKMCAALEYVKIFKSINIMISKLIITAKTIDFSEI